MNKIAFVLVALSIAAALTGCSSQEAKQQMDHAKDVMQWVFSETPVKPSAPTSDQESAKQAADVAAKFARKYFDFASWKPNEVPAVELVHEGWKQTYTEGIKKDRQGLATEFGNTLPSLKALKVTTVEYKTVNLDGKDTLGYRITFDLEYNPNPNPIENHTGIVYVAKISDKWMVFGVGGKVGK